MRRLVPLLAVGLLFGGCASVDQGGSPGTKTVMTDERLTATSPSGEVPDDYVVGFVKGEGNRSAWPHGGWDAVSRRIRFPARTIIPTRVIVVFSVDPNGNVTRAEASGGDPDLNQAVEDAFMRSSFEPALKAGKAIGVRLRQPMTISYEPKAAEPGATDNPDDAQRLREDP